LAALFANIRKLEEEKEKKGTVNLIHRGKHEKEDLRKQK